MCVMCVRVDGRNDGRTHTSSFYSLLPYLTGEGMSQGYWRREEWGVAKLGVALKVGERTTSGCVVGDARVV